MVSSPGALIQATDGNFYGTTLLGGDTSICSEGCGTIFKMTPQGTLTTIHSFNDTDGLEPASGLLQATDGNFYGTTAGGGGSGHGTVFKITQGGMLITMHSFDGGDGYSATGNLMQAADGNLYGTTEYGGANNNSIVCGSSVSGCGTVFKITLAGVLTTLHNFCSQTNCTDGANPYQAGLVQATDGNLYGTTYDGGAKDWGTVFRITAGGSLTTLHSFDDSDGGLLRQG